MKDIKKYVVNLAKDYFKHVVFLGMGSFTLWAGYTLKTTANKYTSLPDKYERLLEIRDQDSARVKEHLKEDSLKEAAINFTIISLLRKVDSTGKECRHTDSVCTNFIKTLRDDNQRIKSKLRIQ